MAGNYDTGRLLQALWRTQAEFNQAVKAVQPEKASNAWSEIYLLGLVGEVDEVLKELQWKRHKQASGSINRLNLGFELADMTKYLLSLWQECGFTVEEFLTLTQAKSDRVIADLRRDWFPPNDRNVIIFDLDGTTADYRTGIAMDLGVEDRVVTLAADLDAGLPWGDYERRKLKWEAEGGYGRLPPYPDTVKLLRWEHDRGTYLFCITARPADQMQNIVSDTHGWLKAHNIEADAVLFGRDERLGQLLKLAGSNRVLLLEDDPTLAARAAQMGFPVWLRNQPYNRNLMQPNVMRLERFPMGVEWEQWPDVLTTTHPVMGGV